MNVNHDDDKLNFAKNLNEIKQNTLARGDLNSYNDLVGKEQERRIQEEKHQEDRSHRKDLVIFAKWFTTFYFGYVGMVILYCGFAKLYNLTFLSDKVITMLLGTTMGHALIILVMVMKYFFKNNDLKKSQNTNT
jgi:hypothetical protein